MKTLNSALKRLFWVSILHISVGTGRLFAFETHEHRLMGNDGFQIALVIALAEHPEVSPRLRQQALEYLLGLSVPKSDLTEAFGENFDPRAQPDDRKVKYGNIVALPDFVRDPESLWENSVTDEQRGLAGLKYSKLAWIVKNTAGGRWFNLDEFYVGHRNDDHFGGLGLTRFDQLHRRARVLAGQQDNDGKLRLALFLNAFADHFLQDYCAPGHIMNERDQVEDQQVVGMHDFYNRVGLKYKVDLDKLRGLEAMLGRLEAGIGRMQGSDPALAESRVDLGEAIKRVASISPRLQKCVRDIQDKHGLVPFYGDSDLIQRDGSDVEQHTTQRYFVTLLTARSALDILEASFEQGARENSFTGFEWRRGGASKTEVYAFWAKWRAAHRGEMLGFTGPTAKIDFGEYDTANNFPAVCDDIWTLAVSYQSLLKHQSGPDRFDASLEQLIYPYALVRAFPVSESMKPTFQYLSKMAVGVSYSYLRSREYYAHGVSERLVFPVPELDFRISPFVGYRWYRAFGTTRGGFNGGLRAEMGYAFLFFSLGGGWEKYPTPTGLRTSPMVQFSASLGMPLRRWPGLKTIFK